MLYCSCLKINLPTEFYIDPIMNTYINNKKQLHLIIISLALPLLFLVFFYITYARDAWFFQDDFGFIERYSDSIQLSELTDFTNFGRFLSRNAYWNIGISYFHHNSQYFYFFNFCTILATSFFLYKLFSEKFGFFQGITFGSIYFVLPSTIENYAWISNSQHLIAHFFVIFFIYLYMKNFNKQHESNSILRFIALVLVLVLGFLSNIYMCMILSLPMLMIILDKTHRKNPYNYVIIFIGVILFNYFYYKLSGYQVGAYSTSYDFQTLEKNIQFYFKNIFYAVIWLVSLIFGVSYAFYKKEYFISWLFIGSFVFFIPFAFFTYQRYLNYSALTFLFYLLAISALLTHVLKIKHPYIVKYLCLVVFYCVFMKTLEPSIRYFSENPRGASQKQQIEFLRIFDSNHPHVKNYCFQYDVNVINTTGVKDWNIPAQWWFLGFGKALSIFVNHEKKYDLVQNMIQCDVTFGFKESMIYEIQSNTSKIEFKPTILSWGPQSTIINGIPNKQPAGGMGLWIKLSDTKNIGDIQVQFAGNPAKISSVQENMITAEIAPESLSILGKKDVKIKLLDTNQLINVGFFEVFPIKSFDFNIVNWGPQETKISVNPNMQPDGGMGIWIEMIDTKWFGDAEVIFNGQSALSTSVQEKLITASISENQLKQRGKKDVLLKQLSTSKVFYVGSFDIHP